MGVLQISRAAQTDQIAAVGLRAHGVDVSPTAASEVSARGESVFGVWTTASKGTTPRRDEPWGRIGDSLGGIRGVVRD